MQKTEKCTIHTIAKALGVAPSTVSRAFNPDYPISDRVRAEILKYAKENGYTPNKTARRLSMNPLRIAVIYYGFYEYGYREFIRGFSDAYRMYSDLKIRYEIIQISDKEMNAENITELLKRISDYDGIIVSGFNDDGIIECFNSFAAKGRAVVSLQNAVPTLDSLFFSGLNTDAAANIASGFIGKILKRGKTKNVAVFTGDRRTFLHNNIALRFTSSAEGYGYNVIGTYDMMDDEKVLSEQVRTMYEEEGMHPDAVFITSGFSGALIDYFRKHKLYESSDLITFDLHEKITEGLSDGTITATVYQNQHEQGKNAFEGLVKHLTGEHFKCEETAPVLVLKDNRNFYI